MKTYNDLVLGGHIPPKVIEDMCKTEPGTLAALLSDMVYNRSHDEKGKSVYWDHVYVDSKVSDWMKKKFGIEGSSTNPDLVVARTIEFLEATALEYVLKNRG
jgi:hypothetical protein